MPSPRNRALRNGLLGSFFLFPLGAGEEGNGGAESMVQSTIEGKNTGGEEMGKISLSTATESISAESLREIVTPCHVLVRCIHVLVRCAWPTYAHLGGNPVFGPTGSFANPARNGSHIDLFRLTSFQGCGDLAGRGTTGEYVVDDEHPLA